MNEEVRIPEHITIPVFSVTEDEHKELLRRRAHATGMAFADGYLAVLLVGVRGWDYYDAAVFLGLEPWSVANWCKSFATGGLTALLHLHPPFYQKGLMAAKPPEPSAL